MKRIYTLLLALALFISFESFAQKESGSTDDAYLSYQQMLDLMDSISTAHPNICMKVNLGTSAGGRQLVALKISDNVTVNEAEPSILFEGGIHGDELVGPEMVVRFARELCNNYSTNSFYSELINSRQIWLIAMINPDGRVNNDRYNENGVDVNRDMGYMWGGEGNSTGEYSQPESKIVRDFLFSHPLSIYISYHAGTETIAYPWSYRGNPSAEDAANAFLGNLYSSTSGYSNLTYGQGYITMYAINGSTKDMGYGTSGIISWSLEVSLDKQPPAAQIQTYCDQNRPSMLAMTTQAGYGLQGTITDSVSGNPVSAVISVNSFYPVYSDTGIGYYHKYLLPGTYTVTISANGYHSKTFQAVSISAATATTLNAQLAPENMQYAYKVVSCVIPGNNFDDEGFTPAVIGEADNVRYSLGKGGSIVIDMQKSISDEPGNDILIVEDDGDPEGYNVQAGNSPDGPWTPIGNATGTTGFDFANAAVTQARYLKVIDDNNGLSAGNNAGFDLDAIQVLPHAAAVYLLMPNYSFVETLGNNNGLIEPGEEIMVTAMILNNGILTADNTLGILSSGASYITLPSPNPVLGTIVFGQLVSVTFPVTISAMALNGNAFTIMLNLSANAGSYTTVFPLNFSVGAQLEDWETGDFTKYPWSQAGDVPWIITTANPYEGTYCARSGIISDMQNTELTGTFTVTAPDSISFYRKVSSELDYDFLRFYIDGVVKGQWSGAVSWGRVAFPLTSGSHTFRWVYSKDQNTGGGSDAAWIDYIDLPPVAVQSAVSFTLPFSTYCYYNPAVTLTGGSPAGGTYSGQGVNNGIFTPTAAMIGQIISITYTVTDTNGNNGSANAFLFIDNCVNINEKNQENYCSVFPNPNSGNFAVDFYSEKEEATWFALSDCLGRILISEPYISCAGKNTKTFSIAPLSPGLYYLSLETNSRTIVKKLIIQ